MLPVRQRMSQFAGHLLAINVKRHARRAENDVHILKFLSLRQSADFDQESAVSPHPHQASSH